MWKWNSGRPTTSRKAGYAPDEDLLLNILFLNVTNSWLYMILFIQVEMWYITYKAQVRYSGYIVAYC